MKRVVGPFVMFVLFITSCSGSRHGSFAVGPDTTTTIGSSAPLPALTTGEAAAGQGAADAGPSSPSTTQATGPRATFINKADAICQASNDRIDAAYSFLPTSPTDEQFADFVRTRLVPEWNSRLALLEALPAPPLDGAVLKQIWSDLAAGYREVQKDPITAFHGDDPLSSVDQAMATYGFQVCGGSVEPAG